MSTEVTTATPENNSNIITSENIDAFKVLNMKSQMNDLQKLAADVKEKQQSMARTDGDIDFIDERIKEWTIEDLKKMNDDEITKICTSDDGTLFLDDLGDKSKNAEFRRDYLVFRKETNDALASIDAELEKLNEAYAEYEKEMGDITSQFGDITAYLKKTLHEKAEAATTEESKQRYNDMIMMIDKALTLENVIEYYLNDYHARTAVTNVKAPKKGKVTIKRYEKVIKDVSCKTDFRRYGGIELRYLPDKYKATYPNAFMYSIVNYIASWHNNDDNTLNGLFLAQFSINLKNLIHDKFTTPEEKETFINAICKVIDLVG